MCSTGCHDSRSICFTLVTYKEPFCSHRPAVSKYVHGVTVTDSENYYNLFLVKYLFTITKCTKTTSLLFILCQNNSLEIFITTAQELTTVVCRTLQDRVNSVPRHLTGLQHVLHGLYQPGGLCEVTHNGRQDVSDSQAEVGSQGYYAPLHLWQHETCILNVHL